MTKLTPFVQAILLKDEDEAFDNFITKIDAKNDVARLVTQSVGADLVEVNIKHEVFPELQAALNAFNEEILFANPELSAIVANFGVSTLIDNAVSAIMSETVHKEFDYEIYDSSVFTEIRASKSVGYTQAYLTYFVNVEADDVEYTLAVIIHDDWQFHVKDGVLQAGNHNEEDKTVDTSPSLLMKEKNEFALYAVLNYGNGKEATTKISIVDFRTFGYSLDLGEDAEEYFEAITIHDQIMFSKVNAGSAIYQKAVKVIPEMTIADIDYKPVDEEFPILEVISLSVEEIEATYPDIQLDVTDLEEIFGLQIAEDETPNKEDLVLVFGVYVGMIDQEDSEAEITQEEIDTTAFDSIGYQRTDAGVAVNVEQTPRWVSHLLIPFILEELKVELVEDENDNLDEVHDKFLEYIDKQVK
jgi:hypothetical protein